MFRVGSSQQMNIFGQWHCGSPAGCNGNKSGYLVNLD